MILCRRVLLCLLYLLVDHRRRCACAFILPYYNTFPLALLSRQKNGPLALYFRRTSVVCSSSNRNDAALEQEEEAVPTPRTVLDIRSLDDREFFADAEFVDFELHDYRPLGCTVEETLAIGHHVFVSKVTPDGHADRAGLREGDVIVGVSGLFGDVDNVSGLGVDKIKGLVASRPDDESLRLTVARGTSILEDHEQALVDLCSQPGATEDETEQCVLAFLEGGYHNDDDITSAAPAGATVVTAVDSEECDPDIEADCMVDNLMNMWADDNIVPSLQVEAANGPNDDEGSKVKPWSSRSSPSGTFVRDPVTGKMQNIDA